MNRTLVVRLPTGWEDEKFEEIVNAMIERREREGYTFHDIKVESGGTNTLLIFERPRGGIVTKGPENLTGPSPDGMGMHSMKKGL